MNDELDRAYSPWTLGPLSLRNRFIKSATNEGNAPGGTPTKALVRHHRSMAAGGVGMTTVAYCAVCPDGKTFEDQVMLGADSRPHLRALTDAVHAEGAAACAQITHGGAFTFLRQLSTPSPVSASGGINPPGFLSGRLFKHAASQDELRSLRVQFVRGAREAREAGFDAVEIHMGHGYLLSQFLSPAYNRRTDEFGGSAERRARFPREVLSDVLDAVGASMAVTCKISIFEGMRGGGTVEEAIVTARSMSDAGAHLIVNSAGMNVESPWHIFGSEMPPGIGGENASALMRAGNRMLKWQEPRIEFREMYLLEASRQIRAAVRTPLAYLGGVTSVEGIRTAMSEGFDAIVMGRALIHRPDLLMAFRSGELSKSGCNHCNSCIAAMYSASGTRCVLTSPEDFEANRIPAATPSAPQ
ncbi:MAG: NADH:flavin oxidoreductase [Sinimarinibacterium flocculans]|uniref:NADH:flavin oxidoreductase n=1 Tax=Sinimarinibacterium flocculans TaxID=985250 RepID=UPI000E883A82|nr:flavin oxidoreductase [Gammaproteobacteria bacterium]